tara:strand:- start:1350 stop:2414 length:1065 start_codon:yes stop_codon:yes gene_type:complete
MNDLANFLKSSPFKIEKKRKKVLYQDFQKKLTNYHFDKCKSYFKILNLLKYDKNKKYKIWDLPFLPVRIFKKYNLITSKKKNIFKTMTSSGTSNREHSKIFLDKENSNIQIKVLSKIVSNYIGNKRLPLLIIDSKSSLRDKKISSARNVAIQGFSIFGYDVTYALNEDLSLNLDQINNFYNKYKDKDCLIFGFTFLVWKNFYKNLLKSKKKYCFKRGIILHGGGWKKLSELKVSNEFFKKSMKKELGVKKVINYYGMVEQTGSIFVECEFGFLHCSIFSDILIRDKNFINLGFNREGLIQLLSLLPTSYPGHNILSEDIGKIIGEDTCKCGRLGKYFIVKGRVENAEIRGCSDV